LVHRLLLQLLLEFLDFVLQLANLIVFSAVVVLVAADAAVISAFDPMAHVIRSFI
jgi:hypothetical protein